MGYHAAPHASLGLLCGLYQFVPQTEGTALLFESEWLPSASHPPPPPPHPPPARPPPIESIRDITGTEKKRLKNQQHSSSL